MDAWGTLIAGSTIETGTALEHLESQGGGSECGYIVLVDGMEVEMTQQEIEVTVDQQTVEVSIAPVEVVLTIDQSPMEVVV